jgi:ABC-2 type transport system ATP-binding protein
MTDQQFVLEASGVVKRYASHTALNGVSIQVPKQSIFGLLGPNGAGKTSLIRIINQITGPDEGIVMIDGEKLKPKHIEDIGYLPEERGLYKKMKVGEQCVYLAQLKGMKKAEAKKELQVWFEKFDISEWWGKKVEELSKGMAQKVQFITTVLHRPKLLILDEPFSGFDPINTNIIKQEILKLRDEGATIMLSTHNMGSVEEICDDITLINKSQNILSGSMSQIKKDFSKNEYDITFKGNMVAFANSFWGGFELISRVQIEKEVFTAKVRLMDHVKLNDFLNGVIPNVELKSVLPVVPTMNDIFIDVVGKDQEAAHDKTEDKSSSLMKEGGEDE